MTPSSGCYLYAEPVSRMTGGLPELLPRPSSMRDNINRILRGRGRGRRGENNSYTSCTCLLVLVLFFFLLKISILNATFICSTQTCAETFQDPTTPDTLNGPPDKANTSTWLI